MTYYSDLSPCDYFSDQESRPGDASKLIAVGWLDFGDPVPRGTTSPERLARLRHLVLNIWSPITFMGGHSCSLCIGRVVKHDFPGVPYGWRNLFIPGDGHNYVSPELIVHYVEQHEYSPPEEFWAAAERCPPLWSDSYFAELAPSAFGRLLESIPPGIMVQSSDSVTSRISRIWNAMRGQSGRRALRRQVIECLEKARTSIGAGELRVTEVAELRPNEFLATIRAGPPITSPAPDLDQALSAALNELRPSVWVDLRMPD